VRKYIQVDMTDVLMTIGKITSSQQDIVFIEVRPEDDTFMETHNGTVKANYYMLTKVGQEFTSPRWFGRIKVKLGNVTETGEMRLNLYDSTAKTRLLFSSGFLLNTLGVNVLHMAFDPLQAGDYFIELELLNGAVGVGVVTDSTLHKAYKEGVATALWDVEAKIMFVSDTPVERPIATVGDSVDSGVTTIQGGSTLGSIMTGVVERNISREGDSLANGGAILTGSYFLEMED